MTSIEISTDHGRLDVAMIHAAGFDSVRMVAIDEDWSALRFRRLEYVKSAGKSASSGKR